jgi:hypothetical protein
MVNLIVEAEIRPEVPKEKHEGLVSELQAKIFDKCQINPKIESVPYGDLPRAEFKSVRILDLRGKGEE